MIIRIKLTVAFAADLAPCLLGAGGRTILRLKNGFGLFTLASVKVKVPKTYVFGTLEAPPRIELGIRALQAPALPLGHGAEYLISLKKGA